MAEQDYYDWQHRYWADLSVEWEKWSEIVAPQAEGFNRPLIDAAGISTGSKVLDLACGAGEPSLTAASVVGPEGQVTASDYSPEMVAVAERRAASKELTNMSFRQADMCDLPFEDDIFDQTPGLIAAADVPATISNWGGDEPVDFREMCAYIGALVGTQAMLPASADGIHQYHLDATKRIQLAGACKVGWKDGVRRMIVARHPELELGDVA